MIKYYASATARARSPPLWFQVEFNPNFGTRLASLSLSLISNLNEKGTVKRESGGWSSPPPINFHMYSFGRLWIVWRLPHGCDS